MVKTNLLHLTDAGLYCPAGDFYIDPWHPVERAVITHAHADHARLGSRGYLAAQPGLSVLRARLGAGANIQSIDYGRPVRMGPVRVSLHPAGHILGSAQVRVEHRGEVWVVSGDYKLDVDPTCTPFEPVPCHVFITESTFGLPIYRWPAAEAVFASLRAWWLANQAAGRASLVFTYALGKAQRVLAGLDPSLGPIYVHGAVDRLNRAYQAAGVALPPAEPVAEATRAMRGRVPDWQRAIVIAPTSARGTPWLRRFGDFSSALASGWMRIRGTRRRQAVDRGFVLSDHADWPGLQAAIAATGAARVWVTHGYTAVMVRWLQDQGLDALALDTRFGEQDEAAELAAQPAPEPE